MARRRGFLAEMQHQAKKAAREADQAARQRQAEQARREREAAQAQRKAEQAAQRAKRAKEQERARLEKEALMAHREAKKAKAEQMTTQLRENDDELANLLNATLDVDDYVDLESLRKVAKHPPFSNPKLETPTKHPDPVVLPPEPVYTEPEPPRALFNRKKKHERLIEASKSDFAKAREAWSVELSRLQQEFTQRQKQYDDQEARRKHLLKAAKKQYEVECHRREAEVEKHNQELDQLIANLGYGVPEAIEEYVGIVLSNSVYPPHFEVDHDFTFDSASAELTLKALVPPPETLSAVKSYRYIQKDDRIAETAMSQKAQKDRYADAVHQVSLRTLHEVFTADRRGLINSISLEVGAEALNPATGNSEYVPFVAVATERSAFEEINLEAVVPLATLEHLGASVSKNPHGLVAATVGGVRKS